ncbi:MAG TPA: hypothetical protein VEG67_04925 [Myxococcota bacterium]|nr:hypothetical protein [Myxococcota bacterium]
MEPEDVLDRLRALARANGIEVRETPGGGEAETRPHSASCRLRGRLWVVLVASDPLEERICALADALDQANPSWLESHYLPPALRARLEARPSRPPRAHRSA